jgi:hypothetical protein
MKKNAKINNEESLMSTFDRLLLLVPRGLANFGVVAAPEELGDFAEGDVVRFTSPERIQDGGNGSLVFVSPAKCEKITDPELAETYRAIIYGGR